ncbi:MAG: isoprenylcysteine carboxylmethyltransferase family protein [Acidobacteriota bacterium]
MLYLKSLFFTIIAPGSLTLLIPFFILRSRANLFPAVWNGFNYVGILIMVTGITIYFWCVGEFISSGKGTPAPYDPPKYLVAQGLYQYSRNPMYVGVSSIILGEAVFFKSVWMIMYILVVLLAFHLRIIYYEEPTLKKLFGASFDEYCRRVPRWIGLTK